LAWKRLYWICELNWQNPANDGLRTLKSIDCCCKPQASSYELGATS
jgi:hypothetical protein